MVAGRNHCSGEIAGPDPPPPGRFRPRVPLEIFKTPGLQGDSGSGSPFPGRTQSPPRSRCCLRSSQVGGGFGPPEPLHIPKIHLLRGQSGSEIPVARSRCCGRHPPEPGGFRPSGGLPGRETSKSTNPPGFPSLSTLCSISSTFHQRPPNPPTPRDFHP